MRPTDKTRKLNSDRFDALSIPNFVKKKGPSHGARHGNTERQRIYHAAHTTAEKAEKKNPTPYLAKDRPTHRESQIAIGWDEEFCARYDAIAKGDRSYVATAEERKRRENSWVLVQERIIPSQDIPRRSRTN